MNDIKLTLEAICIFFLKKVMLRSPLIDWLIDWLIDCLIEEKMATSLAFLISGWKPIMAVLVPLLLLPLTLVFESNVTVRTLHNSNCHCVEWNRSEMIVPCDWVGVFFSGGPLRLCHGGHGHLLGVRAGPHPHYWPASGGVVSLTRNTKGERSLLELLSGEKFDTRRTCVNETSILHWNDNEIHQISKVEYIL